MDANHKGLSAPCWKNHQRNVIIKQVIEPLYIKTKIKKKKIGGKKEWTLTGGVEVALTTKEADFLENPNGDWSGRLPRICLADSTDEVREEDETRAWVAIFLFYFIFFYFLCSSVCDLQEEKFWWSGGLKNGGHFNIEYAKTKKMGQGTPLILWAMWVWISWWILELFQVSD